jgi:hypothetical protein
MSHSSVHNNGASNGRRQSPSPPPHRPHHRGRDRGAIVERIIEKMSANIVYPTLTRTNYTKWSLMMKVNLQAAGLWDVIESGASDYRDNRTTLVAILHVVPSEMQARLAVKPTTSDAWEVIFQVRVGADHIKEANAECLRRDFINIEFKPGELVKDFSLWLNAVTSQLRVLGDDISDKEVIKKMLHVVPDKLKQVVISMETLLNLGSMSIEEAVGMLRAVETRKKKPSLAKEGGGHLLLMEEEWMAQMKLQEGSGSNSGAQNSSGGKGANKSKGDKSNPIDGQKSSAGRDDTCNYCGKKGHWDKECRKKKHDEVA